MVISFCSTIALFEGMLIVLLKGGSHSDSILCSLLMIFMVFVVRILFLILFLFICLSAWCDVIVFHVNMETQGRKRWNAEFLMRYVWGP